MIPRWHELTRRLEPREGGGGGGGGGEGAKERCSARFRFPRSRFLHPLLATSHKSAPMTTTTGGTSNEGEEKEEELVCLLQRY